MSKMSRLFVLCAVVAVAFGAAVPEDYLDDDLETVDASSLYLVYYSRSHPEGIKVEASDEAGLRKIISAFNFRLKTVILFHGWKDSYGADSNKFVRKAILDAQNTNVIKVCWHSFAIRSYGTARNAVPKVGKVVAEILDRLVVAKHLKLSTVTIVGFSLGAHAAGHVGRNLNTGKVGQIVGLDPAGPLMSKQNLLSPNDAVYVQAIHTNAGGLGTTANVGHSDFYPNGGGRQPGCGLDIVGGCAHNRAWALYADSISDPKLIGQECGSYRNYERNRCSANPTSRMGGLRLDASARGVFYMTTRSDAPFAL